jgi:hypothetical protein
VSENRVFRKIFGAERDEVTGGWRELHNEELLRSSPNIIKMIKSRRMRWEGHVARMGVKNEYKIVFRKPEGKTHSEDLGVDERIILKWIIGK